MVGRPKRKDAIQQTTSWRPRTKEIKDKWTELGAGRSLDDFIDLARSVSDISEEHSE